MHVVVCLIHIFHVSSCSCPGMVMPSYRQQKVHFTSGYQGCDGFSNPQYDPFFIFSVTILSSLFFFCFTISTDFENGRHGVMGDRITSIFYFQCVTFRPVCQSFEKGFKYKCKNITFNQLIVKLDQNQNQDLTCIY